MNDHGSVGDEVRFCSLPYVDSPDRPYLIHLTEDYVSYQLPISVKAVIRWGDLVPLLRNEREEWELPGGRLELGENPRDCLRREVHEELGWDVLFDNPFHAWVYEVSPDEHVFVVTYFGVYLGSEAPRLSSEHSALTLVSRQEALSIRMPTAYKQAISLAFGNA